MFENFPYANFHELNMDWIIKVVRDFQAKYTNIEELIDAGIVRINNATDSSIAELNTKYQAIKDAIDSQVLEKITEFNTAATQKGLEVIASIPADYTELSEKVVDLQHEIEDGYNPMEINPQLVEGEAIQSSTGNFITLSGFSRTNYIRVPDDALYIIFKWVTQSPNSLNSLCFYNASHSFISGIVEPLNNDTDIQRIHTIPDNAVYFAYSGSTAAFSHLQAVVGIENTTGRIIKQLPYKADLVTTFDEVYVKQETILQNIRGFDVFPGNLVVLDECVNNAYIAWNTGTLFPDEENYFCTGFIPVDPDTTYKANHGRNYAWYNSAKTYVGGESGTSIQNSITSPANAAFIRFTVNKTVDGIENPLDLYFAKLTEYDPRFTIPNAIAETKYWCDGKLINWMGDSIVAGYDFDEIVCAKLNMMKQYEYGINGSTISLNGNGSDSRDAMCARYQDMTNDCDIVVVSGGTNDWMYAWAPIGDMSSTENTTFYGALKNLCEGLIAKYPGKIILFTTPIKRAQAFADGDGGTYTPDGVMTTPDSKNKYGKTLGDYADIIKEVCGYYSIPVLDMYRESGLNPSLTAQQIYFDEALTHPNDEGKKIMARRVCGWFTQISADTE